MSGALGGHEIAFFNIIVVPIVGAVVVGIVNHYFKRNEQRWKEQAERVNDIAKKAESLVSTQTQFRQELIDRIEAHGDKVTEVFQRICHERQDSCSGKVTLQMQTMEKKLTSVCSARSSAWQTQAELNRRFEGHIQVEEDRERRGGR